VAAIGLVVEGPTDRAAAERLLAFRDLAVDPHRVVVTGGKQRFDDRLPRYNQAARLAPWLALRDADRDAGGCPVALRRRLLTVPQAPALALRLVVRTLDAWLLADREAFAEHFAVPVGKLPREPETLDRPKDALTHACRASRRRAVREAMVPPRGTSGPGPEYAISVREYCRTAWRPDVAADAAPSLRRALAEVDRLVEAGLW
jgi:hypothetical protein